MATAMKLRRSVRLVLATVLGAVPLLGCGGQAFPETFETIHISRTSGGEAYRPEPGMLLDGTLTLSEGILRGARAEVGDAASDSCLDRYMSPCMVSRPLEPIQLNPAQLDELRRRVEAVPAKDCDLDRDYSCDWCLDTTIAVDGTKVGGNCCGELNEDFAEAFDALATYLDELAAGD